MRFVRQVGFIAFTALLVPGFTFAASKEQMEMQRDIAQLQDQVRTLQSGFDQKMAMLQTLVEQALDAGNKANTGVSVLSAGVTQTLDRELRDRLTPVAGLSAKVDNVSSDAADIRNSMADMTAQLNKLQQQLTDVNNAVKLCQTPAVPPPGSPDNTFGAGVGAAPAAPPARSLFDNSMRDYSGGKLDLAVSEFTDFLRFYPDDPNAPTVQEYIGQAHMSQGKYDLAARDFDAVIERYPDSGDVTRDSWFQKGMALKTALHRDDAVKVWRALINKYPASTQARQATEQLRALGLSSGTAARPRPLRPLPR